MTDQYFKVLGDELKRGVYKKGHPFRYISMATVNENGNPEIRTVVLRQVSEDLKLRIYTDYRSSKVTQIQQRPATSLLFYNPKKLLQITVKGTSKLITDPAEIARYYTGVQPSSKKDYTTLKAPGASLSLILMPSLIQKKSTTLLS